MWHAILAGIAVALLLVGCGRPREVAPAVAAPAKAAEDYFPIAVGSKTVRMQLAVRPREMEVGLMNRRELPGDAGMLFIYESPREMGFWMRNTPTPLDIGFFDSGGVLAEVYPMYPFDERTIISRSDRLQFALEMNQGWFGANGVRVGAKLDLKAVGEALRARGFEPGKYGLE